MLIRVSELELIRNGYDAYLEWIKKTNEEHGMLKSKYSSSYAKFSTGNDKFEKMLFK